MSCSNFHYTYQVPDISSEMNKFKDTSWTPFAFESYFIAVDEEQNEDNSVISDHIQELLQEYQRKNEECNYINSYNLLFTKNTVYSILFVEHIIIVLNVLY